MDAGRLLELSNQKGHGRDCDSHAPRSWPQTPMPRNKLEGLELSKI
jgi:hypothetical protein